MAKKAAGKTARKTTAKALAKPVGKPAGGTRTKSASKSAPKAAPRAAAKTAGAAAAPKCLVEGQRAPAFRLPRDGGGTVALADFAGRKLAIFFYPRADTPGCTREAIDFSHLKDAFAACNTAVLGVSADLPAKQATFRDKHGLTVPLGSDVTHTMLNRYGVWGEKMLYGKTFEGIIRTTVLIGADGRVARLWRNVKVEGHAEEVLAAARALSD
ncbi:MAG: bacterioferritin [Proteobacteria bacterium]|nr:MAG: bacterioferritin [Pseudomonadota bacterium]